MKVNIFTLFLFFLFYNCTDKKINLEQNEIKKIRIKNKEGEIIILGEIKSDTIPKGLWTFLNNKGEIVLELDFNLSDSINDFSIKQLNSSNKIIYEAFYSNGNLLNEKSCNDYQEITYENGRFLFNRYLEAFYYNEFGKTKKKELKLNDLEKNIDYLKNKYKAIPEFTLNEREAILFFLNSKKESIRWGNVVN